MFCRSARLFLLPVLLLAGGVLPAGPARPARSGQQSSRDSSAASVPIYINDFELFSSATNPSGSRNSDTPQKTDAQGTPVLVFNPADRPGIQARRLMDFFSITLLDEFKKRGFAASRRQLHPQADKGALVGGLLPRTRETRTAGPCSAAGHRPQDEFADVAMFQLARPATWKGGSPGTILDARDVHKWPPRHLPMVHSSSRVIPRKRKCKRRGDEDVFEPPRGKPGCFCPVRHTQPALLLPNRLPAGSRPRPCSGPHARKDKFCWRNPGHQAQRGGW